MWVSEETQGRSVIWQRERRESVGMQMGCLCVRVIEEVKGSVIRVKGCRDRAGVVHNIRGTSMGY